MGKRAVPDRWEIYKPWGRPVAGTQFFPFKTPLIVDKQAIRQHYTGKRFETFTPGKLLEEQPHLKAVINLTDTTRYYNPIIFKRQGIRYMHIRTRGRIIPPETILSKFFQTVDEFLETIKDDKNALIGVHCTHGLNRTGYFICKYMVERMKINPHQAIKDFQDARGYKIERENYLNDILGGTEDDQQPFGYETNHRNRYDNEMNSHNYKYNSRDWQTKSRNERNWRQQNNRETPQIETNWRTNRDDSRPTFGQHWRSRPYDRNHRGSQNKGRSSLNRREHSEKTRKLNKHEYFD